MNLIDRPRRMRRTRAIRNLVRETRLHPSMLVQPLFVHEGKNVEPLVKSAEETYRHLFGQKIKPEAPDRASIWTDTNVYNELGIPAIKIGPRGRRIGPRNEEIEIDTMVNAAKVYALSIDLCPLNHLVISCGVSGHHLKEAVFASAAVRVRKGFDTGPHGSF